MRPDNNAPILDWKSRHDPLSREYPIRSLIGEHVDKRTRLWRPGVTLNQGAEGACVGFGWTGELLASPRRSTVTLTAAKGNRWALGLYNRAALEHRMGNAFGKSVTPQRPPAPAPASPLLPAR